MVFNHQVTFSSLSIINSDILWNLTRNECCTSSMFCWTNSTSTSFDFDRYKTVSFCLPPQTSIGKFISCSYMVAYLMHEPQSLPSCSELKSYNVRLTVWPKRFQKLLLFSRTLVTFWRHFKLFHVINKHVNVVSTLLRSFWWLNERSTSSIKRDITRQSLRKLMILRSKVRNQPADVGRKVMGCGLVNLAKGRWGRRGSRVWNYGRLWRLVSKLQKVSLKFDNLRVNHGEHIIMHSLCSIQGIPNNVKLVLWSI